MIGVLVNCGAIIVGSLLGLVIGKLIKQNTKDVIMQALGVSVLLVGIMDAVKVENILLLIIAMIVGGLIGSICHIQDGLNKFGDFLTKKLSKDGSKVGEAFVNSSLIFCIGAMVVYGSIEAGLGNNETLFVKSLLDGTLALIVASTLGWGAILSSIPVLVIQGGIALLANVIQPIATQSFLNQLSGIGGVLVICIGINLLDIKKIRTADLMPAIFGSFLIFLV